MTATVTARLFAAAAEAVGSHEVSLDVASVADLRAALAGAGTHAAGSREVSADAVVNDAARVIAQCAVLEAGVRLEDGDRLVAGAVIDVMPPFAGG